jgi:hypothetical protein
MNRLILTLTAFFTICACFAQSGPGYVVLDSGDTLRGHLKLLEGYASAPVSIGLSATEGTPGKGYSVRECKAFAVGEDVYERATVTMNMSYLDEMDMNVLYQDSMLTQTLFLRRIYKGKNLSLLKYHNGEETGFFRAKNVKTHFFVQDPEKTQELIMAYNNRPIKSVAYDPSDFDRSSRAMRQIRPIYRDQLRIYFDWIREKKLVRRIDASEYREDHLLKIITEIDGKFRAPNN